MNRIKFFYESLAEVILDPLCNGEHNFAYMTTIGKLEERLCGCVGQVMLPISKRWLAPFEALSCQVGKILVEDHIYDSMTLTRFLFESEWRGRGMRMR